MTGKGAHCCPAQRPASLRPQSTFAPLPPACRFTYSNKLAFDTSDGGEGDGLAAVDEDGEDSDGSGGVYGSDSFYSPRWEASASEGEDAFPDCGELVFEPSAAGVPGVRMVTTCISGVGECGQGQVGGLQGSGVALAAPICMRSGSRLANLNCPLPSRFQPDSPPLPHPYPCS